MTIWKFQLEVTDLQQIQMPTGATILCVQMQYGTPCLWATVDEKAKPDTRWIRVIGTGHPINDGKHLAAYIGTFQMAGGNLVFHVFEAKP